MTSDVVIFFDGLCEPTNPGGTGCFGYVVIVNGEPVEERAGSIGASPSMTNNIAEYSALVHALEAMRNRGLLTKETTVECRGDSKLVIEQVSGRWRINKEHLRRAVQKARSLLGECGSFRMTWIPREDNEWADRLSQVAYEKATGRKVIPRFKRTSAA